MFGECTLELFSSSGIHSPSSPCSDDVDYKDESESGSLDGYTGTAFERSRRVLFECKKPSLLELVSKDPRDEILSAIVKDTAQTGKRVERNETRLGDEDEFARVECTQMREYE